MSENFSNSDDVFWIDDVWNIIKSGSYEAFLDDHAGCFIDERIKYLTIECLEVR